MKQYQSIAEFYKIRTLYQSRTLDPDYEKFINSFGANLQQCFSDVFTQDGRIKRVMNVGKALAIIDEISSLASVLSFILKRRVLSIDKAVGNFDDKE